MSTETRRILIAESAALMRHLLSERFGREADMAIVGEAACGRTAVELAVALQPDVALVRLELDGMNGADVAQQIQERGVPTRVVLLTAQPQFASLGRRSAAECLSLDAPLRDVIDTVRRLACFKTAGSTPNLRPVVTSGIGQSTAPAPSLALLDSLSARERAVVEKMVFTEQTMSQIARTLSRETEEVYTDSAVKHAMERAMGKLNIEPRTRTALLRRVLGDPSGIRAG